MVKVRMNWENMVKTYVLTQMVRFYNRYAFTNHYMVAFNWHNMVIVAYISGDQLANITTLDKASRGAGKSLRFKPNKAQKAYMLNECETFALCTVDDMEKLVESTIYNKGEIVEKLITELFGQHWEKDNVAFTKDGDLTVNGIAYQIKYEKATFINEKQMARMAQPSEPAPQEKNIVYMKKIIDNFIK